MGLLARAHGAVPLIAVEGNRSTDYALEGRLGFGGVLAALMTLEQSRGEGRMYRLRCTVISAAMACIALHATGENLFTNPGFENDSCAPWFGWSGATLSAITTDSNTGQSCCLVTGGGQPHGVAQNVTQLVRSGDTIRLAGWVKMSPGVAPTLVKATVKKVDGSGTSYVNVASVTASNSDWVGLCGTYNVTVSGTLSLLELYFEVQDSTRNFMVDDAFFDVGPYGLLNSGFENADLFPWFPWSSAALTLTDNDAKTGRYSCQVTSGAAYHGVAQNIIKLIKSGESMSVSGWVRLVPGTSDTTAKISVKKVDASGTSYTNIAEVTASASGWTKLAGNYALQVTGTLSLLELYFEIQDSTRNFMVDDVELHVNSLSNGGFESGSATPFLGLSGATLSMNTSDRHSGSYSCLVSGGSSYDSITRSLGNSYKNGQTVRLSSWLKRPAGSPRREAKLVLRQTDATGTHDTIVGKAHVTDEAWVPLCGYHVLNFQGTLTSLELRIGFTSTGVNFLVDDACMELLPSSSTWLAEANQRIEDSRKRTVEVFVRGADARPASGRNVSIRQVKHAFTFGSCISDVSALPETPGSDTANYRYFFRDVLKFERAIQENHTLWGQTEPIQGTFNYTVPDTEVAWCNANGIDNGGCHIYWAQFGDDISMPDWVNALSNTAPPGQKSPFQQATEEHIYDLYDHFGSDAFLDWNVRNEQLSQGAFETRIPNGIDGRSVTCWMFETARALFPNAELILNDFEGIDNWPYYERGAYIGTYKALIQSLLAEGAPIDMVGLQGHMNTDIDPFELCTRFDYMANGYAGTSRTTLPLRITEFDVETADASVRADLIERFYRLAFSHPDVTGVIYWGFARNYMWRPNACLVEPNWQLNAAGQRYVQLMDEWTTQIDTTTDANGRFCFRGFQGAYEIWVGSEVREVEVTTDGGLQSEHIQLR